MGLCYNGAIMQKGVGAVSPQRKADWMLVLVTAFWGASYYLMDRCLVQLPPLNLNAFRFTAAFVVLGVVFWKRVRRINRVTLQYSILLGLCLVVVYTSCTYGIQYTSISNTGFICALPVVVTPLLDFLVHRRKPEKTLGLALVLCTAGLALLTLNEQFRPALGDIICLGCAVGYAADLLITEKAVNTPGVDALTLGVCQLGVVAVVMTILTFLLETPRLPSSPDIWISSLFLGIFCSGVAFVVQVVAQQHTTATHVGLIFTLEPVFSAIVAFALAGEVMRPRGYVGAALMLLSLLLVELDWSKLRRKKAAPAHTDG